MSRSHTCYECRGETVNYDDAYCPSCAARLDREAVAKEAKQEAETEAAAVVLEKLGFTAQARMLRTKTVKGVT